MSHELELIQSARFCDGLVHGSLQHGGNIINKGDCFVFAQGSAKAFVVRDFGQEDSYIKLLGQSWDLEVRLQFVQRLACV